MWNDFSYWPVINDSTLYRPDRYKKNENILNNSYLYTSIMILKRVILRDLTNEKFLPNSNSYKKIIAIEDGLKRYKKNIEIMALICSRYDIPLIISSQLSLLKENNSKEELKSLTKYDDFHFHFYALGRGNDILVDISKKYNKNTFYYNPLNNIKVNLDLMRDHIHPTEKGNLSLGTDIGNYIIENIIVKD